MVTTIASTPRRRRCGRRSRPYLGRRARSCGVGQRDVIGDDLAHSAAGLSRSRASRSASSSFQPITVHGMAQSAACAEVPDQFAPRIRSACRRARRGWRWCRRARASAEQRGGDRRTLGQMLGWPPCGANARRPASRCRASGRPCRPGRRDRGGSAGRPSRSPSAKVSASSSPILASGPKPCGWNMTSSRPGRAVRVARVAAILSGLCAKSSITVTPLALPTVSSRRFRPGEGRQRRSGVGQRHAERMDRGERGERIHGVVAAGERECDVGRSSPPTSTVKRAAVVVEGHVARRAASRRAVEAEADQMRRRQARRCARLSGSSRLTTAVPAAREEAAEQRAQFVHLLVVEADSCSSTATVGR